MIWYDYSPLNDMKKITTTDKIILTTAGAGLLGWLIFKNKLKALLKEKVKKWTAESISDQSGIPASLGRAAAELILD